MKPIKTLALCLLFGLFFMAIPQAVQAENASNFLFSEELRLEKLLEERVKTALDTMLGPNNSIVAIDVKLKAYKGERLQKRGGGVLPGIPDIKTPEAPENIVDVEKIEVNVGVPEKISDRLMAQVQNTVIELVGLNAERGDKLIVRKVQIVKDEAREIYRTDKESLKETGGDPKDPDKKKEDEDKGKKESEFVHDISARTDVNFKMTKEDTAVPMRSREAFLNEFTKARNIFGAAAVLIALITLGLLFTVVFMVLWTIRRGMNDALAYLREKQALLAELKKMEAGLLNPDGSIPGEELPEEEEPAAPTEEIPAMAEADANGVGAEPVPAEAVVAEGAQIPNEAAKQPEEINQEKGGDVMAHEQGEAKNHDGGEAKPQEHAEGATPEQVAAAAAKPEETVDENAPFAFLRKAEKGRVADLLLDLTDDEAVAVLSHMTPSDGAAVLKEFPDDKQVSILVAMANRRMLDQEKIDALEKNMAERLEFTVGGGYQISRIIDKLGEAASKRVLETLQQAADKKDLYARLRKGMMFFEDLSLQSDDTLQRILRNVDTSELAVALKGQAPEFIERVTKNLTEGAAQILQEEMEFGGSESPVRIQNSQESILSKIKQMEAEGRLVFQRGGGATAEAKKA